MTAPLPSASSQTTSKMYVPLPVLELCGIRYRGLRRCPSMAIWLLIFKGFSSKLVKEKTNQIKLSRTTDRKFKIFSIWFSGGKMMVTVSKKRAHNTKRKRPEVCHVLLRPLQPKLAQSISLEYDILNLIHNTSFWTYVYEENSAKLS